MLRNNLNSSMRNPVSAAYSPYGPPSVADPNNPGGRIINPSSAGYKKWLNDPNATRFAMGQAQAMGGGAGGGAGGGGGGLTIKREGANEFAMERDRFGLERRLGRLEDKNLKDQIVAEGQGVMQGGKAGKLDQYANKMMANQRNMRRTREELMRMEQDPDYATNRLYGKYGIGRVS
jgi:hypothetical protein